MICCKSLYSCLLVKNRLNVNVQLGHMRRIENDEDTIHYIVGKVLSVDIKDYYFYDNGVHVYITVSIDPLEELNSNIDPESLVNIPLNCILNISF